MEEINRKIQPGIKPVDKIKLFEPEKVLLSNGIPVYLIDSGTQEIIKVEFVFDAGKWFEDKVLVSSFTNSMLKEGSKNHTSREIAEKIDFYGAHLETSTGPDTASVTVYTLNKYLDEVLTVTEDIIRHPVFPDDELKTFLQNKKQEFIINNEKVRHLARRLFNKQIFGSSYPYGKTASLPDFDNIYRENLSGFHKKRYTAGNCRIIVSGKLPSNLLDVLEKKFGTVVKETENNTSRHNAEIIPGEKKMLIEKDNALQSAIRIGKVLFNKTHPDYLKLKVVNAVLGGYFGSRLMTNIREDKGYTYGIGSAIVSLHNSGYFFIASEVGKEVGKAAVSEIYKEIEKLQQEKVGEEELSLVKNYLLGSLLRSFDGPFAIAESFKSVMEYGLDTGYFQRYIETVKEITAEEIMELAGKYFDRESLYELIVG